jgi:hypothetical protein
MTDVWVAGEEVYKLMQHFVANYHPSLAGYDKDIAILMRGKASKRGGQKVLGTAKKAPPILDVLGKDSYKFILEIAADEWQTLTNEQQGALMDHLLCACRAEEDEKTQEMKFSIAAPEVSFYWDELKRHGDWRPRPQQEEGSSMDVEDLLGGLGGEEKKAAKKGSKKN